MGFVGQGATLGTVASDPAMRRIVAFADADGLALSRAPQIPGGGGGGEDGDGGAGGRHRPSLATDWLAVEVRAASG